MANGKWQMEEGFYRFLSTSVLICHLPSAICHLPFSYAYMPLIFVTVATRLIATM